MRKKILGIEDICTVLFAFITMGILGAMAIKLAFLGPVAQTMKDFSFTDIFYHVLQENGTADTSHVITIVDMTDLPSREAIADKLEEIEAIGPKVVGVDVVFEGLKDDTLSDLRLANIAENENIVFSYRVQDYVDDSIGYSKEIHSFFAQGMKAKEGYTNFERRLIGGLKRNVTLRLRSMGQDRSDSFVWRVASVFSDGQIAELQQEKLAVNFRPTIFRVIPSDSIQAYRDWIEGHVVLFGATAELADRHYTPLGEMPGVELIAYSVQTMLENSQVRTLPVVLIAVISFLVVLLTHIMRKQYLRWGQRLTTDWLRFMLTSTFFVGLLVTLWTILLVWIAFLIFYFTGYNVNLGWAMAAIPFLGGAKEFYGIMAIRSGQ